MLDGGTPAPAGFEQVVLAVFLDFCPELLEMEDFLLSQLLPTYLGMCNCADLASSSPINNSPLLYFLECSLLLLLVPETHVSAPAVDPW